MRKRTYLVCAIALLFLVPVAIASESITPIIFAVSPGTPVNAIEGDMVAFSACIDNPQPPLPLKIEWFLNGVPVYEEPLYGEGGVFWTSDPLEAGTHEVQIVVTAIDETTAVREWVVIVEPLPVAMYGTVFIGAIESGIMTVDEVVVSKALIKIKDSIGNLVAVTKTDAAGQYSVELISGRYTVSAQYRGLKSDIISVDVNGVDVKQNIWL